MNGMLSSISQRADDIRHDSFCPNEPFFELINIINRNTLVCNMISYVDFYKPSYFMLENVTGMIVTKLNGIQSGRRIEGGVGSGVVKFIFRSLVALG
jgi:hypothetical protein